MASLNEVPLASGVEGRQAALDAVLHSRTFAKNLRLSSLLEYLCTRCFRGEADALKEYNIATDVFGRPAEFDQSQDAIVRVEMHRLRKKLAEFYATEGAQEPVEIVIHSGRYLPEFVLRHKAGMAPEEARPEPTPEPVSWREHAQPATGSRRSPMWLIIALLVAGLATTGAILWRSGVVRQQVLPAPGSAMELPPMIIPPSSESVRILCGAKSGYRDRQGNQWMPDAFFSGGTAMDSPDRPVYRTRDSFLFRSARAGESSYKIPLKQGVYELRLYFADAWYSPGVAMEGGENTRVFHVILNGETLLRDFDIIADAGPNTADVRVFKDVRPETDGYLHLNFAGNQGPPLINAIEIAPGIPHRLRPIRLVTQDSALTDRTGVTWSRDNYFLSGRTIARTLTVTGNEDPEIYARERYGNFSYAIPVSEGRYRVILHFAETYWGPKSPGGGGAGTRVFDVYCNGTTLLRNFDMLRDTGAGAEIVKTFDNLAPNAQGKLVLSFVPVKNYANLSAIEVVDEPQTR